MSDLQKQDGQKTLTTDVMINEADAQSKTVHPDQIPHIAKEHEKAIDDLPDIEILAQLLPYMQPINFREKAGITDEKTKLSNQHRIVCVIDEVLQVARLQHYGLCMHNNSTYCYNNRYWELLGLEELKYFLGKAAAKLGVELIDAKWYGFQDELLKQFMVAAHLPKARIVKGRTLVNLSNGTLEISTDGQEVLREHRPEDFLTYLLPFEYNQTAVAPLFYKYLDYVLPDDASQKNIAEYVGSVFTDSEDLRLEQVLLLQGNGRNGKSVMQLIIIALLGAQNVSNFTLQSLTDYNGYYRAEFANKLVNVATEINNKIETSIFKQLASGEPVEARSPYGKPFSLRHYGKMIFNCNLLPTDVEQTEAFFRRWLIIEFGRTITEQEADIELPKKIIGSELSGVLNWVLAGLKRLLKQKSFTENPLAKAKLAHFKKQTNNVALFLEEENYSVDSNEIMPQKELYTQYVDFCIESGYRKCAEKTFGERLDMLGFFREKRNVGKVVYIAKKDY